MCSTTETLFLNQSYLWKVETMLDFTAPSNFCICWLRQKSVKEQDISVDSLNSNNWDALSIIKIVV